MGRQQAAELDKPLFETELLLLLLLLLCLLLVMHLPNNHASYFSEPGAIFIEEQSHVQTKGGGRGLEVKEKHESELEFSAKLLYRHYFPEVTGFSQIWKRMELPAVKKRQTARYEFMNSEITFSFVPSPWERFNIPVNGDGYKK